MFKVTLTGNCGSTPETKFTQEGKALMQFNIAVNSRRKNKDGEFVDHTDWVRVRTMRSLDYLQKVIDKGSRVIVSGDLHVDTYQDKNGETRVSLEIPFPDTVEVATVKTDQNGQQPTPVTSTRTEPPRADLPQKAAVPNIDDEDLPF